VRDRAANCQAGPGAPHCGVKPALDETGIGRILSRENALKEVLA
jgi:hypothetical protein